MYGTFFARVIFKVSNGKENYSIFYKSNDENAFAEIIKEYRDGLIFYINSIVCNLQTAEEIAEDTFVLLYIKKPRDNGKGSFKTWLYTIGRNRAYNYLKKSAKKQTVCIENCFDIASDTDIEKLYIKSERNHNLHKAIRKLKYEYRQVLYLIYFENFSIKDTAKIMKKSVHNTETLVYRARKALKTQLEKDGFDYENL